MQEQVAPDCSITRALAWETQASCFIVASDALVLALALYITGWWLAGWFKLSGDLFLSFVIS